MDAGQPGATPGSAWARPRGSTCTPRRNRRRTARRRRRVWSPTTAAAGDVRDLVVALVRAGVTSTTSLDTGTRYGALRVDSNLPDTRIARRRPGPQRVRRGRAGGRAGPATPAELDRQLAAAGRARVWVPAERPLAEVWEPSADLRGERALPVLVVAGRDDAAAGRRGGGAGGRPRRRDHRDRTVACGRPLRSPVGVSAGRSPVDVSAGRSPVGVSAGRSPVDTGTGLADAAAGLAGVSVAMLSRGLPGFAVDRTGALHLSLARSCTGWPSAVWITKPRRTVPDGSGFQLQHWTHTFDYALTSGPGDWRSAGFVAGRAGVHRATRRGRRDPPTPARCRRCTRCSRWTGRRRRGHRGQAGRHAAGVRHHADPADRGARGPAVRGARPAGHRPAAAGRRGGSAERADLLDRPIGPLAVDGGAVLVPLGAVRGDHGPAPARAGGAGRRGRLVPEPGGVVPARYWLENAGPAPAGNLPVSVHARRAGRPVRSSCGCRSRRRWPSRVDRRRHGDRAGRLVGRAGGVAGRAAAGRLGRGAGAGAPAADAPPGDHLVAVSIEHAGQTVREPRAGHRRPARCSTRAGSRCTSTRSRWRSGREARDTVRIELANSYRSPLDATLELLGPVDTWPYVPQWTVPVRLDGDDRRAVELPVVVPAGAAPGEWWLLARLSGAGQVAYSDSVPLTIA